ncbi:MAG: hypothetical protein IIA09_10055 [Proteobacteria bacterium]|nr:hypothetical protein [Pseudomonadota bacterium]
MKPASDLLMWGLKLNAIFSVLSAIAMLLAANWLAGQVGLPGPANVYAVAIFLLFFAAQLGNIVRTGKIRSWEIVGIIAGDLSWVAGSVVLGAVYFRSFSTIGAVLVDAAAIAVLIFAIMQIRGLREHRRNAYG